MWGHTICGCEAPRCQLALLATIVLAHYFITNFYLRSFYCITLIIVKKKERILLFDFSIASFIYD